MALQMLGARTSGNVPLAAELYSAETMTPNLAWATMYTKRPNGSEPLFQLEGLVARRMELLAMTDQLVNSPKTPNSQAVVDHIAKRLEEEKRWFKRAAQDTNKASTAPSGANPGASTSPDEAGRAATKEVQSAKEMPPDTEFCFNCEDDLVSHLLCRFAFCMSDKWRNWYIKMEEILLRARIKNHGETTRGFMEALLSVNQLPCELVNKATDPAKDKLQKFVEWRKVRDANRSAAGVSISDTTEFIKVPMHVVPKMVKSREVLCHGGMAYVARSKITEVFINIYKYNVARGLNDAWKSRTKMHFGAAGGDGAESNLMAMLDSFLTHFVAEPVDRLQVSAEGSVRAGDIAALAQIHMPLCMRNTDVHLRAKGHLKHHGRFQYGLFLKAIGLSCDDALTLFGSLMTVSGGGSQEAFNKSAYGYNIRHKYGREGKKTSYSSLSCATVVGMPPNVDQYDCHGCPFRFKDEGKLRETLKTERPNPNGPTTLPKVCPSNADIEDIVKDAKEMHYTRACYKYFMATHEGAKKDSLFRSPYEYFTVSRDIEEAHKKEKLEGGGGAQQQQGAGGEGPSPAKVGAKRTLFGTEKTE